MEVDKLRTYNYNIVYLYKLPNKATLLTHLTFLILLNSVQIVEVNSKLQQCAKPNYRLYNCSIRVVYILSAFILLNVYRFS